MNPLLKQLLDWWNHSYDSVEHAGEDDKFLHIADLIVRFLKIHPFLDTNGRMSEYLLRITVKDILGKSVSAGIHKEANFIYALMEDDAKGIRRMANIIRDSSV